MKGLCLEDVYIGRVLGGQNKGLGVQCSGERG